MEETTQFTTSKGDILIITKDGLGRDFRFKLLTTDGGGKDAHMLCNGELESAFESHKQAIQAAYQEYLDSIN
jgi:hypothetical protein